MRGAFNEYLRAAYLQNVGYLSTWRPADVARPFFVRNAPLLLRAGIVVSGLLILFWKKNKLSKQFLFLTAWLLLSLFAVTLSERPYPHYLLQSVPAASLLLSILFTQENLEQTLAIIPLTLTLFVPVYFNFWYYPTTPYYIRFIKFATGKISKVNYISSFGNQVLRNYKIADYIASSTKSNEKIFVWGDGSSIYALSRRLPAGKYAADYHIKDFSSNEETMRVLTDQMPSFIVVLPDSSTLTDLNDFLSRNYGLVKNINNAQIWKLLGPRIRALIAS
jgi:hypothetical protein